MDSSVDFSQLLNGLRSGEPEKMDQFARLVQSELRGIAASYLRREWASDSLQPTELVNECYLRLFQGARPDYESRGHFFGIAARSMRQILVDRARRRAAVKRPDGALKLSLEDVALSSPESAWQVLAIHEALERLEKQEQRLCRLVELRFFAGLPIGEVAEVMGLSTATLTRDWAFAKAWLHRELS